MPTKDFHAQRLPREEFQIEKYAVDKSGKRKPCAVCGSFEYPWNLRSRSLQKNFYLICKNCHYELEKEKMDNLIKKGKTNGRK